MPRGRVSRGLRQRGRGGVKGRRLTAHLCGSRSSARVRSHLQRSDGRRLARAVCSLSRAAPGPQVDEAGETSTAQRACTGSTESACPASRRSDVEISAAPARSPRASLSRQGCTAPAAHCCRMSAAYGNFYLPYIYMGDLDGALAARRCAGPGGGPVFEIYWYHTGIWPFLNSFGTGMVCGMRKWYSCFLIVSVNRRLIPSIWCRAGRSPK